MAESHRRKAMAAGTPIQKTVMITGDDGVEPSFQGSKPCVLTVILIPQQSTQQPIHRPCTIQCQFYEMEYSLICTIS